MYHFYEQLYQHLLLHRLHIIYVYPQTVKCKAADGLESIARKKKKRTAKQNDFRGNPNSAYIKRATKVNQLKRKKIKKKDLFDDDE